jgi:hypothetical protein
MSSVRNYIDVIPSPKLVILEAQLVLDPPRPRPQPYRPGLSSFRPCPINASPTPPPDQPPPDTNGNHPQPSNDSSNQRQPPHTHRYQSIQTRVLRNQAALPRPQGWAGDIARRRRATIIVAGEPSRRPMTVTAKHSPTSAQLEIPRTISCFQNIFQNGVISINHSTEEELHPPSKTSHASSMIPVSDCCWTGN